MEGQINLFTPVKWQECFKTCKYFNEVEPDTFPATNIKRCQYCNKAPYGTSGEQFVIEVVDHRVEMYCILYEE